MKGKLKKNILIFFLAIVSVAFVAGYMMWNKPHKNIRNAKALRITAIDLYKIFTTDSVKARSIYLDKVVLISGEVKQVSRNQQDQQIILLKTGTQGASVNCTMEGSINSIKEGDAVLLKGICSGYINGDADMGLPGDVFLIRCYSSS